MRKIRTALAVTAALLLVFTAASCSAAKSEYTDFTACGIRLPVDSSFVDKGLGIQCLGSDKSEYPSLFAFFQYAPALDALNKELEKSAEDGMTQELFDTFMERAMQHYKRLAVVYAVPAAVYSSLQGESSPFSGMKQLGSYKDRVYLVRYEYEGNSTDGMSKKEKALYDACVAEITRALAAAEFIDITDGGSTGASEAAGGLPPVFPAFRSFDVQGNAVSEQFFSKADLTVVNVWGTFCGPCIQEMPALAEWSSRLPEGVQILGLLCDVNSPDDEDGLATARDILGKAGVRFTNILATDDLQGFLSNIMFVPTTLLVDRNAAIVGEPIVGVSLEKYQNAVNDYFAQK